MKIGAAIVAQKLRRGYLLAYKNEGALLAEDTIYIASCAAKNERYCQMERREEPEVRLRESALGGQVATALQGHDLDPFQAVDTLS